MTVTLQPVAFRDRLAAAATRDRFYLASHIDVLEDDHPDRRFVSLMCWYARDVLTGVAPGPYSDSLAEFCVRAFLVDDHDFAAVRHCEDAILAEHFAVPLDQVAKKRLDLPELPQMQPDSRRR